MPQNSLKMGVNRQFQAKLRKCKNRSISKTVNPIKPKFEDKAETTTCISRVGYHYPKQNPAWLTAAILLQRHNSVTVHPISVKFGVPMENHMPMTVKRSKYKPEVELQYGGRLFLETGSSNISAVD